MMPHRQRPRSAGLWARTTGALLAAGLSLSAAPASALTLTGTVADGPLQLTVDGFVGVYYSYVIQNPENGVSTARLFASRHNSLSVSGASLGFELKYGHAFAYVAPWFGLTPTTIYSGEPEAVVAGGVGPSDATVWRYLRAAYGGFELGPWTFDGGLFVSPIGFEGIAAKDNWMWSSSWQNYFFPFYHFGARAHYTTESGHTLGLWVVNGFSGGVDINDGKSIIVTASGRLGDGQWQVLYYGGPERSDALDLDLAWVHFFDAWVSLPVTDVLEVAGQADVGFEPNDIGVAWWIAGSVYGRVKVMEQVSVAARLEIFAEDEAENDDGVTPRFFSPADWVFGGSLVVEYRPVAHTAVRLEYRHDQADTELFFRDDPEPASKSQDALTLGLTVWM